MARLLIQNCGLEQPTTPAAEQAATGLCFRGHSLRAAAGLAGCVSHGQRDAVVAVLSILVVYAHPTGIAAVAQAPAICRDAVVIAGGTGIEAAVTLVAAHAEAGNWRAINWWWNLAIVRQ